MNNHCQVLWLSYERRSLRRQLVLTELSRMLHACYSDQLFNQNYTQEVFNRYELCDSFWWYFYTMKLQMDQMSLYCCFLQPDPSTIMYYLHPYPGNIAPSQPFLLDNVKASPSAHLIRDRESVGKGKLSLCTSALSKCYLPLLLTTKIIQPWCKQIPVYNFYPTNLSIIFMHVLYSHHNCRYVCVSDTLFDDIQLLLPWKLKALLGQK